MIDMTRRSFLGGLAVIAITTMTPGSAEANAYASKIYKIENMFNTIVETDNLKKTFAEDSAEYIDYQKQVDFQFVHLLHFMNENFTAPTLEQAENNSALLNEISNLFYNNELVKSWREIPPTLIEQTIPLAVIREIMCIRKIKILNICMEINIDGNIVVPFIECSNRYQYLILAKKPII